MNVLSTTILLLSGSLANAFTIGVSQEPAIKAIPIYKEAIKYITEGYRRIGVSVELLSHSSDKTYRLVEKGMLDAELIRVSGLSKQFPHIYKVPFKLLDFKIYAYSILNSPDNITLKNAGSSRIGVLSSTFLISKTFNSNNFDKRKSLKSLLSGLVSAEYDYILLSDYALAEIKKTETLYKDIIFKRSKNSIINDTLFHYVHIKHKSIAKKLSDSFRSIEVTKKNYPNIFSAMQ